MNLLQWGTEYSQKFASYSLSTTENEKKVKRKLLEDKDRFLAKYAECWWRIATFEDHLNYISYKQVPFSVSNELQY